MGNSTGFSLSENETEGPSNALYADDTACGTATIEVIDNYGVPVTGYVRCTTGQWVLKGSYCELSGNGTFIEVKGAQGNCMARYYYEIVSGNKKQVQMSCYNAGGDPSCEVAMAFCTERCDINGYDCKTCIDQ